VSYFIKIRHAGALQFPEGFDYRPANPSDPDSISLRGNDMSGVLALMRAVEVLDLAIDKPGKRKKTTPGKVPLYKFQLSDGHQVTAEEARTIVDAFDRAGAIDAAFIAANFPKIDTSRPELVKVVQELADVWIAFNRVAAANDGYTVG